MSDLSPKDIADYADLLLEREHKINEISALQDTYIKGLEKENDDLKQLNALLCRDIVWNERWAYGWMWIALFAWATVFVLGLG